jgi:macrodomain Ter protein organizer (MatP/YcbG family)
MEDYLENLPLSSEEKAKINALAVDSPAALLSMIEADPETLNQYLGEKATEKLKASLQTMLKPSEKRVLQAEQKFDHQLGAIVGRNAPNLQQTQYNIEERDRLFAELQYWKTKDDTSANVKAKIAQLNQQLEELLTK